MSRLGRPKQFQPLVGADSLFQLMVRRLAHGFDIQNVFVSTGEQYRDLILEQVPDLPPENIIAEPEMRDTLAAVGYAVTVLDHRFPGTTVATLWGADHVIRNDAIFLRALQEAASLTRDRGWVVKIDVPPTFPSTALGYIEIGERIDTVDGFDVHAFVRQIEKPDEEAAEGFLASRNFLWNTGYIVWTTSKILELYAHHVPEVSGHLVTIGEALGTPQADEVIRHEFPRMERLSIDYGLFQKMGGDEFAVIPVQLGWSDIGAWNVLRDELRTSPAENVVRGEIIALDTHNSLIYGQQGKPIVTIGLEDMIVVDTPDALYIAPAERSQDIKRIVERLKSERPELL
jgi:mannose-1-phosphate guanylyltransferase